MFLQRLLDSNLLTLEYIDMSGGRNYKTRTFENTWFAG